MKRRDFIFGTAAAGLGLARVSADAPSSGGGPGGVTPPQRLPIRFLREKYRRDLFVRFLPFWEQHGIDREHGGFICGLDHDGTRVSTDKHHWFQGRGIWVWSHLYNHFGRQPQHLEPARRAREFLRRHAPRPGAGGWPAIWARDGRIRQPFAGDTYGMLFAAEGYQEYAAATGMMRRATMRSGSSFRFSMT